MAWAQSATDGKSATLAVTETVVDEAGTYIDRFTTPQINNAGQVLIRALLEDVNGDTQTGYFLSAGAGSELTPLAITGRDLGEGNTLTSTPTWGGAFNNAGQVAFTGSINDDSDDRALFLGDVNGLSRIARVNDPVPDEQGGTLGQTPSIYGYYLLSDIRLNDAGQVSFTGGIKDADDSARLGVFRATSGGWTQVAREFQSIPGDDATLTWYTPDSGGGADSEINAAGQVLFSGQIDEPSTIGLYSGLFLGSGGQVARVAATGDHLPGSDETFGGFRERHLDNSGGVHFYTNVNDAAGDKVGNAFFYVSGNNFTQLARTGQALADGNTLDQTSLTRVDPRHNESGQVAFHSRIRDAEDNLVATGIFAAGEDGLVEIARRGDPAPDGNGTFDLISNAHERIIGINDAGVVAFRDRLNDSDRGYLDSQGIFLSDGIDTVTVVRGRDEINGRTVFSGLNQATNLGGVNNFGQVIYEFGSGGDDLLTLFTPDLHYRAQGDGSFDQGDNWTLSLNPGDPHDVFLKTGSDVTVTAGPGSRAVNSLEIGGGEGQSTLYLSPGSTTHVADQVTLLAGGRLSGEGEIAGDVTNAGGTLAPGSSPGTLSIEGDYTQEASSSLVIEIAGQDAGTQHDVLSVTGDATLDGELVLRFTDGFSPDEGDVFNFLQVLGETSDDFDQVTVENLMAGFEFDESGIAEGNLLALNDGQFVPEPGSLSLLGLGGMWLMQRRRGRV